MINPFWVVLQTATGRLMKSSAKLDTTALLFLVDGWWKQKQTLLDYLADGTVADPGGDAAVLVHNPSTLLTVAIRDRFGIHSIYYAKDAGHLHVSSSISGLKQSGFRLRPDPIKNCIFVASHYRYFTFPKNSTFFIGVFCLMPGEYLKITSGSIITGSFTDLELADLSGQSEEEIGKEFLHRLKLSVAERLALVKRPAFTLSSGMDSSTVVCLAARTVGSPTLITTIYDAPTPYDESAEISHTAKAIGGEWLQIKISVGDVLSMIDRFAIGSDEPCPTVTQMVHRIVAQRVADLGHDALFSGLGGDEATCGEIEEYLYYFADLRSQGMEDRLVKVMVGWTKYHETPEYPKTPSVLEKFFANEIDFNFPGRVLLNQHRYDSNFDVLSQNIIRSQIPRPQLPNPFTSYLVNKLYQDLFFETIPPVLRAEMHNTRTTGVATLYPFLDQNVIFTGFQPH